jgi:hypothetical protein
MVFEGSQDGATATLAAGTATAIQQGQPIDGAEDSEGFDAPLTKATATGKAITMGQGLVNGVALIAMVCPGVKLDV